MPDRWRVKPGRRARLADIDPAATPWAPPGGRPGAEAALPALHDELLTWQERLWAEGRRSLLVVLQAMDAGGKDGVIRHVFRGVNPQGVRVTGFKVPTPEEAGHDFLWRVHRAAPQSGEIGIFNRSHYEDVLAARVHELAPEPVWQVRCKQINDFEELLVRNGTTLVKLHLRISKEEQRRRLQDRLARPDKRWKFRAADLAERARWDDYQAAYEDAISRTSTEAAPWHVIPADHKWYRDWAVSQILIGTLRRLDPRYPEPENLDGVTVV